MTCSLGEPGAAGATLGPAQLRTSPGAPGGAPLEDAVGAGLAMAHLGDREPARGRRHNIEQ